MHINCWLAVNMYKSVSVRIIGICRTKCVPLLWVVWTGNTCIDFMRWCRLTNTINSSNFPQMGHLFAVFFSICPTLISVNLCLVNVPFLVYLSLCAPPFVCRFVFVPFILKVSSVLCFKVFLSGCFCFCFASVSCPLPDLQSLDLSLCPLGKFACVRLLSRSCPLLAATCRKPCGFCIE